MRKVCVALAMVLLMAGPAMAQTVVFNNGGPDYVNGNEMTQWTQAEDFELPSATTVGAATFSMLDQAWTFPAPWDGTLDWWIYTDSAGLPGSVVASGAAQQVSYTFDQNAGGFDFYDFSFDLGQAVALNGSTRYWFALHMASDWASRDNLYWSTTAPGGFNAGSEDNGGTGTWATNGNEHSFALLEFEPAIPVASDAGLVLLIVLLAGAGILAVRRMSA